MRSAFAPSGEFRSEGAIRSGSVALRRLSLHDVAPNAARVANDPTSKSARVRAVPRVFDVSIYEISEAEVDAERVIRRDSQRLELLTRRVGSGAGFAGEPVDFRIDAAVLRPQVQV